MKRGFFSSFFIIILLLLSSPLYADRIGALNSEEDGTPGDAYAYKYVWPNGTLSCTDGVCTFTTTFEGPVSIGTPNSTEGAEKPVFESMTESDTGTEKIGGAETVLFDDETDGTEDTTLFKYRLEAGAQCVAAYFGPPLAAAPSWTPCTGCRILSDGNGSDPFDAAGGLYWTGSAWAAD